ncbi:MAG: hypothetical protein ABII88_09090 [Candidatus Omnitrophota bacterium]
MNILPDPRRQGDIHFIFAKSMPYMQRIKVIMLCMLAGILVQLLFNFWAGLFLLIAGTAVSLIKGYSAKPSLKGPEEWSQVTPDEYKKVKEKQKQLKRWDIDLFDITNPLGGTIFAILAGMCFVLWIVLDEKGEGLLGKYLIIDCLVVLAPHWVTGVRTYLTRDKLISKINILEKIMKSLEPPSDVQILPMLSTQESSKSGRVPVDARLMIRFLNAPAYFLGVQVQISMNTVQGKDYPYLYCVIIAKEEAKFFHKNPGIVNTVPRNMLFEKRRSNEVDVLVIRQQTTQTSGYHTNMSAGIYIVVTTIATARKLLEKVKE